MKKNNHARQPPCRRCGAPSANNGKYKGSYCWNCVNDVMQRSLFDGAPPSRKEDEIIERELIKKPDVII